VKGARNSKGRALIHLETFGSEKKGGGGKRATPNKSRVGKIPPVAKEVRTHDLGNCLSTSISEFKAHLTWKNQSLK